MPNERDGHHNAESLALVVKKLGRLMAEVEESQATLELPPGIKDVLVPREPSLEQGLARLASWTSSLRRTVDAARLNSVKGVSDGTAETAKHRKKK